MKKLIIIAGIIAMTGCQANGIVKNISVKTSEFDNRKEIVVKPAMLTETTFIGFHYYPDNNRMEVRVENNEIRNIYKLEINIDEKIYSYSGILDKTYFVDRGEIRGHWSVQKFSVPVSVISRMAFADKLIMRITTSDGYADYNALKECGKSVHLAEDFAFVSICDSIRNFVKSYNL